VVIFFSVGFLAGVGLLCSVWRRYFKGTGFGALLAGTLALGLANLAPAIMGRCDVYEVAISCGYAQTLLALAGVWGALLDARRRWCWLAAASLVYSSAVGARPTLLLGAVILLVPVARAWREKRPVWPLLPAAGGPIVLVGLGMLLYNALRFDNPLEFGQRYQLPLTLHRQFSLRYLGFNFWVGFLEPARWRGWFPFVHDIALPAMPEGYGNVAHAFGVLTNIPLVWLALAAPLAWRGRSAEERSMLRGFLGAVALLFGMCALPLCLHDSMCLRYELEYASPLVLLAVIGILALERALASQPAWRRAARCGWGLLLAFSAGFGLLAGYELQRDNCTILGNTLLQGGRLDEAIIQYQKALEINPHDMEVHGGLACLLAQRGRAADANAQFQEALELEPRDGEAHNNLGYFFAQRGRVDEAVAQYQMALKIEPAFMPAYLNLGNAFLQKGEVDGAVAQYRKALEIKPDSPEARYNLGSALAMRGNLDEAVAQYRAILKTRPDYPEADHNLGRILLLKGDFDEALAYLDKSPAGGRDLLSRWDHLGDEFLQGRNWELAIPCYRQAAKINPRSAEAYAKLGLAFSRNGEIKEAEDSWQQALEIKPDQLQVLDNLAWLLATTPDASLRNGAKAVTLAAQAVQLNGEDNPTVLRTLAAAYAEAGNYTTAAATAQRALHGALGQKNDTLAATLQQDIGLYETDKPLRDAPQ
jgi:tetratricopeptide (TPR) repeat protein